MLGDLLLITPGPASPTLWDALSTVLKDNPVVMFLGSLLVAFLTGFQTRQFFKDRKLERLDHEVHDLRGQAEVAREATRITSERKKADEERAKALADFLSPEYLKEHLTKYLSEWDAEAHDRILAGVMRQLIATPGTAVVCTPSATVHIEVDPGDGSDMSCFRSHMTVADDPLAEVRQLPLDSKDIKAVMAFLTAYGVVKFPVRRDGRGIDEYIVFQRDGSWNITKREWRKSPPA